MGSRRGFSSSAAIVLAGLALTAALLFMWKVWTYYDQITSGKSVSLPQFNGQFTVSGTTAGPVAAGAHPEVATPDDPAIGPDGAKLAIVEFLDYQCPYCNEESSVFRELTSRYGDRVRFIVRDFPVLELHPQAVTGAEAAGCAEVQGKFWPMHDRLFALKGQLARADVERAARQSGLDMTAFIACMDGHARIDEIQADAAAGVAAGVRGTPTFFFNGRRVEGVIPRDVFETLIARFLNS